MEKGDIANGETFGESTEPEPSSINGSMFSNKIFKHILKYSDEKTLYNFRLVSKSFNSLLLNFLSSSKVTIAWNEFKANDQKEFYVNKTQKPSKSKLRSLKKFFEVFSQRSLLESWNETNGDESVAVQFLPFSKLIIYLDSKNLENWQLLEKFFINWGKCIRELSFGFFGNLLILDSTFSTMLRKLLQNSVNLERISLEHINQFSSDSYLGIEKSLQDIHLPKLVDISLSYFVFKDEDVIPTTRLVQGLAQLIPKNANTSKQWKSSSEDLQVGNSESSNNICNGQNSHGSTENAPKFIIWSIFAKHLSNMDQFLKLFKGLSPEKEILFIYWFTMKTEVQNDYFDLVDLPNSCIDTITIVNSDAFDPWRIETFKNFLEHGNISNNLRELHLALSPRSFVALELTKMKMMHLAKLDVTIGPTGETRRTLSCHLNASNFPALESLRLVSLHKRKSGNFWGFFSRGIEKEIFSEMNEFIGDKKLLPIWLVKNFSSIFPNLKVDKKETKLDIEVRNNRKMKTLTAKNNKKLKALIKQL